MLAEILATINQDDSDYLPVTEELRQKTTIVPLLPILEPEEPWKRSLQALIYATSQESETPQATTRMIWMVAFEEKVITISPKEQKLTPEGEWSKGRPISLARLYKTNRLNYLTSQDRRICAAIKKSLNPETHGVNFYFDMDKALPAMIGHPNLYLAESPLTPVEFVAGEPELFVEEQGDNLHICFAHPITSDNVNYYSETPTRVKIININDNHRRIAQITGKDGITVPIVGKHASTDRHRQHILLHDRPLRHRRGQHRQKVRQYYLCRGRFNNLYAPNPLRHGISVGDVRQTLSGRRSLP